MGEARRYNKGKTRFELIPSKALEDLADVYTRGAHKYTIYKNKDGQEIQGKDVDLSEVSNFEVIDDGADNWRKGLPWLQTLGSIKRHISAFEKGEDVDPELGTKHLANAAWGLFTLLEYYKIAPHFDDRNHGYLSRPKVGLDIDEVLADWVGHWTSRHGLEVPETWNFDRDISAKFELLREDKEFWLSIPVKTKASDIGFEPHCYITSRSIPVEWTKEWLDKNGFPTMPVYCVGFGESKVEVAKASGIDWFVDDRYENFVELNKAGICTYLFDAPHNQRYDVGYKRIKSLKQLW